MYRRHEDPYKLEKELKELNRRILNCTDDGELEYLHMEKAELKERINIAWQDEYQEEY